MTPRSLYSLLGVIAGFACVFPLLVRREKKAPASSAEALLAKAQMQMRDAQAKNRVRAVEAITQKNILQALADQTEKMVVELTERSEAAEDAKTVKNLLIERDKHQQTLMGIQAALVTATAATEAVKIAMRREEERIRAMTAEALALKAQEKQAQIETAIAKSKLAMTSNLATDLFVQAREKIKQAAAQRDLIVQISRTVETLEAAAEEADTEASRQKLMAARDALRQSALNASLWKS